MNPEQRKILKRKILKRYELYKIHRHRFQRFVKDPLRTFIFYILASIARIKPFKITAKTLWGEPMTYYLPEGQAILYYGFFEANLTNFYINNLEEGDVFVDIGAHVGFYSMLASTLVGDSGKVHSFEPTPRTFISLEENLKGKSNAKANNFAALNEKKTISFVDYGPKFSAFNSFHDRTGKDMEFITKNGDEIQVPAIVLDSYFKDGSVTPTYIKIDAEGAEHLILQGMKETLTVARPVVSIEVAGDEEWQENCRASIEILLSHDYEMFECTLEGMLKKHVAKATYSYDNLVFIPKERVSLMLDRQENLQS